MTRRMTLLVLALVGLMVLVVTVSPPQRGRTGRTEATATPTPTRAPLLSDPDAFDVTATFSVSKRGQTVRAELGDRVQIVVNGNQPDAVQLGELDTEDVERGLPARFALLADTPGSFPLVLLGEDRQIGTLEVR
jgi:hypothetical protein